MSNNKNKDNLKKDEKKEEIKASSTDFEDKTEEEWEDDFDFTEEDANYENSNSSNGKRKKIISSLSLVIGVILVIFLVLFLFSSCSLKKKSFSDIEIIMTNAAKSYFAQHQDLLPKREGGHVDIDVSALVADGKMKELSVYTKSVCTGMVRVEKVGTTYSYIPKLNCGNDYYSSTLANKISEDNEIVNTGYGFYRIDGNLVFRGEKVNNYVKLENALWRIVKVTSNNEIVLVLNIPLSIASPWDDRYNSELNFNGGINNYRTSRLKENVDDLYTTQSKLVLNNFLSDKDKTLIVPFDVCIGKRGEKEVGPESRIECREVLRDQKIGLLTAADFMNASVDSNCKTISSLNCQNYNYLKYNEPFWLLTSNPKNSNSVYVVDSGSGVRVTTANMYAKLRPVIHLNGNILYKSGSGSINDPYTIKF